MIEIKTGIGNFDIDKELDKLEKDKWFGCLTVECRLGKLNSMNDAMLGLGMIDADEWIRVLDRILDIKYMEVEND